MCVIHIINVVYFHVHKLSTAVQPGLFDINKERLMNFHYSNQYLTRMQLKMQSLVLIKCILLCIYDA